MKPRAKLTLPGLTATSGLVLVVLLFFGIATLTIRGVNILALLAVATTSLSAPTTIYLSPSITDQPSVGQIFDIDININARAAINAIGTTIKFPEDSIEIIGVSKAKSFLDLWTEETAIKEDAGEIHFSGGTTNHLGITGTGTALTITVRAKKPGVQKIYFSEAEIYANDGNGTELDSNMRSLSFSVPEVTKVAEAQVSAGGSSALSLPAITPNADLDGSGRVTIVDVSIMITRLVLSYDPRFDLDRDGSINLSDLSIVLSRFNQSM